MIHFFEKFSKHLEIPLSTEDINDIQYYCDKQWYIQVVKQFGIIIALILIEYYKYQEEYLVCKEITEAINNSNKYFGTNYPITLEEYGIMS